MGYAFGGHGGGDVPHIWAQQKGGSKRNGNVFFEGTKIYSYGYHFCMANFIKKNIVLYNCRTFSNTTSGHQSSVRRALKEGIKIFSVPSTDGNHKENMQYFLTTIRNLIFDAGKSRTKTNFLLTSAESIKQTALDYAKIFKCGCSTEYNQIKKIVVRTQELIDRGIAQFDKEVARNAKKEAEKQERVKEAMEAIPLWHRGRHLNGERLYELPEAFIRVAADGETIETTHGARVPLTGGKILFDMIRSGRDIKGHQIGHYTVIGINGVLTIGCHKIPRAEIERFAQSQGWI